MKTGFADLDRLMEEEMEEPFALALLSNDKDFMQFLFGRWQEYLKNQLVVLTERLEIKTDYVDCFTWSGLSPLEKKPVDSLGGPTALNNLSLILADSEAQNVVFYKFSPFLIYNKETTIDSFLRSIIGKAKDRNRNLFLFVESDIVSKEMLSLLESRVDYVLRARRSGGRLKISFRPFVELEVEAVQEGDQWRLV